MNKPMILYRGTLKSCNYHCSYCPFARHPMGKRELEHDKAQWEQFVRTSVPAGALMVVPYGEALIHPWYWKGLGILSTRPRMDAVGAQTNLSFPIEPSLDIYKQAGGDLTKLRLWATFHPEMITAEAFASACRKLRAAGVHLCAGAVGVPGNLEQIRCLRQALPAEVYLWINRMDGMNRDYTQKEADAFLEIDPYFLRELVPVPAEPVLCQERLFVEGNGQVRLCNISQAAAGQTVFSNRLPTQGRLCRRKFCSCYLAYGGRNDFMNQVLFGPYPLFRIPRRPGAVFLDIIGTLLPDREERNAFPGKAAARMQKPLPETPPGASVRIPQEHPFGISALTLAGLEALKREHIPVFFATTLPYGDASTCCGSIRHLFSGGIFSGGAHIRLEQEDSTKEYFYYLPETFSGHMTELEALKKRFRYRILLYRNEGKLYKVTLLRPRQLPWREWEASELARLLALDGHAFVRYFLEGCCLQIVSSKATKEQGVRLLCQWLGISPEETAAAGNSGEDAGMIRLGQPSDL